MIETCAAVLALVPGPVGVQGAGAKVDFARDVRPILAENCFQCHGPDDRARKAGLRLDLRQRVIGAKGVVEAGRPAASELYRRITHRDPDERMPPVGSGKQLSAVQIDVLRRWIEQGATWSEHWAFAPVTRPPVPAGEAPNPIDRFVRARLAREGLAPSPPASREEWLRRVSFDLCGMPPSPREIDAFLADRSERAYEKVVDRLLASPRWGEHQARFWLDTARYADTNGYQYDRERTQWPWRDWVIRAFNRNQPFDEFTVEQLAGDLLPDATLEQKIATGFNRNHPITIEGGVIDEEYRTEYVIDRVVTTSTTWLGLTMLCARCHDHKFDPVTQKEFYRFFAFFNQVPERGLNGFDPRIAIPSKAHEAAKRELVLLEDKVEAAERDALPKRREWERRLVATRDRGPAWQVVAPVRAVASPVTELVTLEDASVLARGETKPGRETYDIVVRTGLAGVTAIRLECLTDESLPHNGPGRAFNSNFVLTDFAVEAAPLDGSAKPAAVRLVSAVADYSQRGYEIAKAIDRDRKSGWAVDGPTHKEPRVAVFTTERPIGFEGGTELHIHMRHDFGAAHTIGRFRLALTTRPGAGLDTDLATIAAIAEPERTRAQQARLLREFERTAAPEELRKDLDAVARLEKRVAELAKHRVRVMVMAERHKPRTTHVLERGQYDKPREVVTAGTPSVLPPMPADLPRNRLGLARWLVSDGNPLTARVAVNRFWQHLFGVGLVKTSEDFGSQGSYPSHPKLLDWLASEFVRTGWDVKRLHKLIVLSATYRQTARVTPELLERDPDNRLLARGPRRRLDAEEIRDQALLDSGLLIEKIGGPSVYPYHPKGLWLEINNRPGYSRAYPHRTEPAQLYRRSLYTFWKRTVPPPAMQAFDAPGREVCVVRRSSTNTPLQPFVLLHGPQFVEAARFLAERVIHEGGSTDAERLVHGFRIVTGRRPRPAEIAVLRSALLRKLAFYGRDRAAAEKLVSVGVSARDRSIDVSEHAAWTAIAQLLLNLSEAVTD